MCAAQLNVCVHGHPPLRQGPLRCAQARELPLPYPTGALGVPRPATPAGMPPQPGLAPGLARGQTPPQAGPHLGAVERPVTPPGPLRINFCMWAAASMMAGAGGPVCLLAARAAGGGGSGGIT